MLAKRFTSITALHSFSVPDQLNDPFEVSISEVVDFAAKELQSFILEHQKEWQHDFGFKSTIEKEGVKGKMFGVLVVQTADNKIGYLAGYSGKLPPHQTLEKFVPSVFDDSTDNYFINRGMAELTAIGLEIKNIQKTTKDQIKIAKLKTERTAKSIQLQQRLFENYVFNNQKGESKNLCSIFEDYNGKKPPAAAGECAAPKLLQYAFDNKLSPIGIAEFWWGKSPKSEERVHLNYYPACMNKCRPILSYMLN